MYTFYYPLGKIKTVRNSFINHFHLDFKSSDCLKTTGASSLIFRPIYLAIRNYLFYLSDYLKPNYF